MARYVLRRLAALVAVAWFVVTATFALTHAVPGGPFDRERAVPLAVREAIARRYRLDDPLWKQYADYLAGLARFDLGPSLQHQGQTVNGLIAARFPVSALLGFLSVALSLAVGIPLGALSALRRNRAIDHAGMFVAIVLVSVPSFVLAPALIFLFGNGPVRWLHVLPAYWGSGGAPLPGDTAPSWQRLPPLVIPVLSLAGFSLAYIARLARAGFIEVLQQDYMRTARAKGLSWPRTVFGHGLRQALFPVAAYLGPLVAGVFTGSFVIERIYGIPGLGQAFVTSLYDRDYPVILGLTVFYCAFLALMNLLVDLAYPLLDPRVSLGKTTGP